MTADLRNLVVEVLHNRGDDDHSDWSVGSGFFVGRKLVLTASHNVDGPGELLVRVHGKEEHPAVVRLQGDKDIVDLAVLEISDVAVDVPPLRYGTVDRSVAAVVERCWAVGFPRFKEQAHDPKPLRLNVQVDGEIPTSENWGQPLLTLRVRNSPRPLPGGLVRESEWEGVSGATVFSSDNIIVGVITEHHLPEGESTLTLVPITALDLLPEAIAMKWWKLLGVDHQALVRLPGEALSSLSLPPRPKNYIPFSRSPLFQSRPGEFERLEQLLFGQAAKPQSRRVGLVGMIGMGGIGKTQLAIELAHHCKDRFPAGIFWMPATGTKVLDWQPRLAELAARTDYLPPDDDPSSPEHERRRAQHFCRYLAAHKDALLILDNVEDPLLVTTALPRLAGDDVACTLLYTSRNQQALPGVITYAVEQLLEEAALRLLLETTRPALLSDILAGSQDEEACAARDICRGVGGLPLALVHLCGLLTKDNQQPRDSQMTVKRLAEVLKQRGALELAKTQQGDAAPLFATFRLSWERVSDEGARRLFKLASFFPEATPIPLWLLGLAAGLGEVADILEPLGEARMQLQELSLLETLSGEQVRLHPLIREFGQRLIAEESAQSSTLRAQAAEAIAAAFTDVNWLEDRAQRKSYWPCLEDVRAARNYVERLSTGRAEALQRVERWLDRESYL